MADGYGFGAEGDWKTAVLVRAAKVMGAGLPGGASLMEDYTYDLTPGDELILGAHMLEVCPSLTTARPTPGDPPARHRRQGGPGPAGLQRRPRPRRSSSPCPTCATASGWSRTWSRWCRRPRRSRGCRSAARCGARAGLPDLRDVWLQAGAAHHTCMSTAVGIEAFEDFARMAGTELLTIDETTTVRAFENEMRWNAAYYRLARGI